MGRDADNAPGADKPFDARLVPLPDEEAPETVWQLTRRITDALEIEFPKVWVVGEVSNFKRHTSGHLFFTLKDDRAALRCIMWRSTADRLRHAISDGLEVEARGHIGVFEKAGNYQLYVSALKPRGVGALEVAFRQLKEKLGAEGLFDPARKRPLPRFPRRVGVVTSATGAAVRDILHVLGRRWPPVEIVLAPARVQGEGAAAEIARGIENLNRLGSIDVMIVGRGGGSLEDLWPFNEEAVARAIFASQVPVVSAVGHETDFSISDFVADVRAPTPSAAAELVVPDAREVLRGLGQSLARLGRHVEHCLRHLRDRLALAAGSRYLAHPEELVLGPLQTLEDLARRMGQSARDAAAARRLRLERAGAALAEHAPRARWQASRAALGLAAHRLATAGRTMLVHRWGARLDRVAARLADLSPGRVLARGYSRTVLERTGGTLTRAADARPGDLLRTHLSEGSLRSEVHAVDERRMSNVEQEMSKDEVNGETANGRQAAARTPDGKGKARPRRRGDAPGQARLFE